MYLKTYIIGDVHGCYHTLVQLINKLPRHAELIFVGDLCDRGLFSKDVIEFVKSNNHSCIKGNHEHYMLENIEDCIEGRRCKDMRYIREDYMGGVETIKSYKHDRETLQKHLQWLKSLPNYIIRDNCFITHGFCQPYFKRRDDKTKEHAMLVNRSNDEEEWGHDWEEGWREYKLLNIYGHEHNDEVVQGANYICIDTGCVYGGKLTALELGSMKIIDQKVNERDINKQK